MNKAIPYLVIGFAWLLILNLIDHTGEFPLIDDWAYAHGVKDFLDTGVLKISDWVAMTQVAHLFMGVGWSEIFGYSLESLREMTLLVSFLGSFVFYWLTGYFSKSVVLRLIGTLILTVNPIWMYLSHTFMTDIPFTTLFFALVLILIKIIYPKNEYLAQEGQEEHSTLGTEHSQNSARGSESAVSAGGRVQNTEDREQVLLAAHRYPLLPTPYYPFPTSYFLIPLILLLSSVLVLIRQTGLGLGFSFLLWVVLMDRDRRGKWLGFGLVLVGVQVATLVGYEWYMASIDALSTRYHGASSLSWILGRPWWPVRAAYYVLIQLQYLGMFLLPLLPFVWMKWRSVGAGSYSRWAYVAAGVVVLGMGVAVGGDILMNPRYTHLMQYDTVGHVMTIDFTYERLEFSRDLYPLWVVLHAMGLINIYLLVVVGSRKWGVVVHSSQFTAHSEGIDEGRGMSAESAWGRGQSAESAGGRGQSAGDRDQGAESVMDTARHSRYFTYLFSLLSSHKFNHPVTWILFILGGYTVFISIGQFVFDRYLMLHLPLMILAVLYLIENQGAERQNTVNIKRKTESFFSAQRSDSLESAGGREETDEGRVKRDEGINTGTGGSDQSSGSYKQVPLAACCSLLFLSFLFSTIGVHDSFEWNRVRFGAIEQLEAQGVTPHQIDGGAEYNSWQRTGPLQPLRLNEKSWWYVDGDEYAVAHEEIPGYERISAHPFTRYFGLERDTLYVIKRFPVNGFL